MAIGNPISPAQFMGSGNSEFQQQYSPAPRYQIGETYTSSRRYGNFNPAPAYRID